MRRSATYVLALALAGAGFIAPPATADDPPGVWTTPLALGPSDAKSLATRTGLVLAAGRTHFKDEGAGEVPRPSPRVAGIFLSTDRGSTWSRGEEVVEGPDGQPVRVPIERTPDLVALAPSAAPGSPSYAVFGLEVWRSDDDGMTWGRVGSLPAAPSVLEVFPDGRVVAGLAAGGLRVSADRGATWAPLGMGLPAARVNDLGEPDGELLLVATDQGVYRSTTAGQTFTQSTTGLLAANDAALALADAGLDVYLAMPGPSGSRIYETFNEGGFWRYVGDIATAQNIVPRVERGALSYVEHGAGRLYAGTQVGLVRTTVGAGVPAWERLDPVPGSVAVRALAVEDTDPGSGRNDVVYGAVRRASVSVTGATGSRLAAPGWYDELQGGRVCGGLTVHGGTGDLLVACGRHVLRSNDGGATWSDVSAGLPYSQAGIEISDMPYMPLAQSADGSLWTSGFHYGLWKSNPGVTSWTRVPYPGPSVGAIAAHPTNPNVVYASGLLTNGSFTTVLWRTENGGTTWERVFTADALDQIYTIDVSPLRPDRVLLCVNGGGAYVSEDGGDTWTLSNLPVSGYSVLRAYFSDAAADDAWALSIQGSSSPRWILFRSVDGARTWTEAGQIQTPTKALLPTDIYPSAWDRDTIYVADGGFYVSRQAGAPKSFEPFSSGLGDSSFLGDADNLTFHPTQPGVLFATGGTHGLGAAPPSLWVVRGLDPTVP